MKGMDQSENEGKLGRRKKGHYDKVNVFMKENMRWSHLCFEVMLVHLSKKKIFIWLI
ncbi:hypothetical protein KFK09_001681 [Dendrobium nobile]|uniref:Uncharacterized protein n=1 Tax=Dendrobium nobile TaxID=94219 RepID=A0A8T3C8W0_DENNO|nr:hypothetical protein KFK09_001681 [Dendrobium nobile]